MSIVSPRTFRVKHDWRHRPRATALAFDRYINDRLDTHFAELTAGFDPEVQEKFHDRRLGNKTEVAFRVWNMQESTKDKAVDVQALGILHHMYNQIRRIDDRRPIWLPTQESLWSDVDETLYRHLGSFVLQETGTTIAPFTELLPDSQAQPICAIEGRQVARAANLGTCMVRYTVG